VSVPTLAASRSPLLGCATDYTVALMPRGGTQAGPALGVLSGITSLSWGRTIDNPSQCKLAIALPQSGDSCCQTVRQVEKWATELAVFRHTGSSIERVWEGPVIQREESVETGQFTVVAFDVLEWFKARVNHTDLVFPQGLDASTLVAYCFADGLLPDDPYITEHMVVSPAGGSPVTDNTPAESVNVWQHVGQILQSQVDVTTVGRRIVVMGEGASPWSKVLTLGPDDFAGDVVLGDDGTDFANRMIVQGSAVSRTAKRTRTGQIVQDDPTLPVAAGDADDTYHGLVEHLVKMNQVTTRAQAWGAASSLLAYSQESSYVRASDGAQLQPTAPVKIRDLVCGTGVAVVPSRYFCSQLDPSASYALQSVSVNYTPENGETVGISVGPVNQAAASQLQQGG